MKNFHIDFCVASCDHNNEYDIIVVMKNKVVKQTWS